MKNWLYPMFMNSQTQITIKCNLFANKIFDYSLNYI